MSATPDLVVAFQPRGILSLLGAVIIVAGVWHADRTWDEKGSTAYERAKTSLLVEKKDGVVEIPVDELNAAFPFPWAFLLGWVIYGVANVFSATPESLFDITLDARSVSALCISLALGWIASVPVSYQTMGFIVCHLNLYLHH